MQYQCWLGNEDDEPLILEAYSGEDAAVEYAEWYSSVNAGDSLDGAEVYVQGLSSQVEIYKIQLVMEPTYYADRVEG